MNKKIIVFIIVLISGGSLFGKKSRNDYTGPRPHVYPAPVEVTPGNAKEICTKVCKKHGGWNRHWYRGNCYCKCQCNMTEEQYEAKRKAEQAKKHTTK